MADAQRELEILREQCPTICEALENAAPDGSCFAGLIYDDGGNPYPAWGISTLRGPIQYAQPKRAWDTSEPAEACWLEHSEDSCITELVGYVYLASDEYLTDEAYEHVCPK